MNIENLILKRVQEINSSKELKKTNWSSNSKYEPLRTMNSIDDKGEVGEMFLYQSLKERYNVIWEKSQTENDEDIIIEGIKFEVKLATLGNISNNFQHEKFFKGRNYDAILFLDFSPDKLHLTYGKKSDIVWENLHQRSNEIIDDSTGLPKKVKTEEYKFDISLNMIENNDISGTKGKKLSHSITKEIITDSDLFIFIDEVVKDYYSK